MTINYHELQLMTRSQNEYTINYNWITMNNTDLLEIVNFYHVPI